MRRWTVGAAISLFLSGAFSAWTSELDDRQNAVLSALATLTVFAEDCPALTTNNDTLGSILLGNGFLPNDFDPGGRHHDKIAPAGIKAKAERATVRVSQRCDFLRERFGPEGTLFVGLIMEKQPQFDPLSKRWLDELKRLQIRTASATARRDKEGLLDVARETYRHYLVRSQFNVPEKGACSNSTLTLVNGVLVDAPWDDAKSAAMIDDCHNELAR